MNNAKMLALMIDAKACTAWRYSATDKQWIITYLKGDESFIHNQRPDTLDELLLEMAECLNDDSLQTGILQILFDAEAASLLTKALETLRRHKIANWQLLDLEYWLERTALQGHAVPCMADPAWVGKHVLPLLVITAPSAVQTKPETTKTESPSNDGGGRPDDAPDTVAHLQAQQEIERLNTLNGQYMEQIRALHAELESKALVNPAQRRETLIAFMPVVFKDFWSKVTPATVASLLHVSPQQLPEIPSPYPNPDMATVLAKKKQFSLLPPGEQQGVWQFCTLLDYHHLSMHPEFKPLFEAWQAQIGLA
jgi:hypothetical protein